MQKDYPTLLKRDMVFAISSLWQVDLWYSLSSYALDLLSSFPGLSTGPASEDHTGNGRGERDWLQSMYDIAMCKTLLR